MTGEYIGKSTNGVLPNITGGIDAGYSGNSNFLGLFNNGSGCFAVSGNYNQRYPSPLSGGVNYTGMSFDASRSSSIYGNGWYDGKKVIPAGSGVSYIIKY